MKTYMAKLILLMSLVCLPVSARDEIPGTRLEVNVPDDWRGRLIDFILPLSLHLRLDGIIAYDVNDSLIGWSECMSVWFVVTTHPIDNVELINLLKRSFTDQFEIAGDSIRVEDGYFTDNLNNQKRFQWIISVYSGRNDLLQSQQFTLFKTDNKFLLFIGTFRDDADFDRVSAFTNSVQFITVGE